MYAECKYQYVVGRKRGSQSSRHPDQTCAGMLQRDDRNRGIAQGRLRLEIGIVYDGDIATSFVGRTRPVPHGSRRATIAGERAGDNNEPDLMSCPGQRPCASMSVACRRSISCLVHASARRSRRATLAERRMDSLAGRRRATSASSAGPPGRDSRASQRAPRCGLRAHGGPSRIATTR